MAEVRDFSIFVRPADAGNAAMDLAVEGIHCAACMRAIEKGLATEPGVAGARVNLANRRVTVEWDPGRSTPERILDRMDQIGFKAYPFSVDRAESADKQEEKRLLICLAVAGFAMMNIMLLSVSVWAGNASDITSEARDFFHWLSALIALPAAIYAGRPFFESAARALKARAVNMDVPISLGVILALGMSVVETLNHAEHAYFDSAVMLLFFLLVGRYLERAMRRRTRAVATNLAALKAETEVKFISGTEVRTVPVAALQAGAAAALMMIGSADAAPVTFVFNVAPTVTGSGFGNSYAYTSGGLTVTVTAWSFNGTTYVPARVVLAPAGPQGLGVCNTVEGEPGGYATGPRKPAEKQLVFE